MSVGLDTFTIVELEEPECLSFPYIDFSEQIDMFYVAAANIITYIHYILYNTFYLSLSRARAGFSPGRQIIFLSAFMPAIPI